jgi:hypothetical protein
MQTHAKDMIYIKHGTCNLKNMIWEEFLSVNRDEYPCSFENPSPPSFKKKVNMLVVHP